MIKNKIIVANWKMNMTNSKARDFVINLKEKIKTNSNEIVLCVPFTSISSILEILKDTNIKLGAQNLYFEEEGAFTGEISASMLKDLQVKYVIIGHFERRKYFLETDEIVNKKIIKALEYDIKPIVCVGENLKERENGLNLEVIRSQIKLSLKNINKDMSKNIIIAYEPIWSIGTKKAATIKQVEEICIDIRNTIKNIYDEEVANKIKIIYGGSINNENASEFFKIDNIDGGLVGNFSLNLDFYKIVN